MTIEIRNTTVFRGPNVWARMPAIVGTHVDSDIHRVKGHGGITVSGAVLHVLTAGNRFDVIERKLRPTPVEEPRLRGEQARR